MTIQECIQGAVEQAARDAGFVLYTDYAASNVGNWRFYPQESYALVADIRFDFQTSRDDYFTFQDAEASDVWKRRYTVGYLGSAIADLTDYITSEA